MPTNAMMNIAPTSSPVKFSMRIPSIIRGLTSLATKILKGTVWKYDPRA